MTNKRLKSIVQRIHREGLFWAAVDYIQWRTPKLEKMIIDFCRHYDQKQINKFVKELQKEAKNVD